ncbi:hypothetical protein [Bradyrhizobium lablabi]|uniref:hypothetical protein n=1 Tax=Bradyrhizobium lablabi TaxID=722472 RepID=UPI00090C4A1A|nr:hypothetical protein [Bradyrhizobium lablabi]SHL14888.1 hypothetical protein SAMN05444321_1912 [Bradyrhizobium lablabi]
MRKATNRKTPADFSPPRRTHAPVPVPPDAVYISAKQVLARFGGRSEMWLVRKLIAEADFPRPVYSGRLRFFRIDELEQYEKQMVQRRAKAEA